MSNNLPWKPDEVFEISSAFSELEISEENRQLLRKHLIDHKFFLENSFGVEITDSEAYFSWKEYVEEPAYNAFLKFKLFDKKGMTWPMALIQITDRWHFMKEADKERKKMISLRDAAKSFA